MGHDRGTRALEQRYRASGDLEDGLIWLRAAERSGELPRWRIELAARCGHPAATALVGEPPEAPSWSRGLEPLGTEAIRRYGVELTRTVGAALELDLSPEAFDARGAERIATASLTHFSAQRELELQERLLAELRVHLAPAPRVARTEAARRAAEGALRAARAELARVEAETAGRDPALEAVRSAAGAVATTKGSLTASFRAGDLEARIEALLESRGRLGERERLWAEARAALALWALSGPPVEAVPAPAPGAAPAVSRASEEDEALAAARVAAAQERWARAVEERRARGEQARDWLDAARELAQLRPHGPVARALRAAAAYGYEPAREQLGAGAPLVLEESHLRDPEPWLRSLGGLVTLGDEEPGLRLGLLIGGLALRRLRGKWAKLAALGERGLDAVAVACANLPEFDREPLDQACLVLDPVRSAAHPLFSPAGRAALGAIRCAQWPVFLAQAWGSYGELANVATLLEEAGQAGVRAADVRAVARRALVPWSLGLDRGDEVWDWRALTAQGAAPGKRRR